MRTRSMTARAAGALMLAVLTASAVAAQSPLPGASPAPGSSSPPGATPSTAGPQVASPAPAPLGSPSVAPSVSPLPSPSPSGPPQAPDTLVGVVLAPPVRETGLNVAAIAGAEAGAGTIGAARPEVRSPDTADAYAEALRAFAVEARDIVVAVGGSGAAATIGAAREHPEVRFIGVDQNAPCVDATGLPDATGTCAGDAAALLPNLMTVSYREDQAGYLAGILAASLADGGQVGALGATTACPACVRYLQGFELGARSVDPKVEVVTAYLGDHDMGPALNDPAAGAFLGGRLIETHGLDVVFAAAGQTGNGILEAACAAGILGIGSDGDQGAADRQASGCTVSSATKGVEASLVDAIVGTIAGTAVAGHQAWDASRGGVGLVAFGALESKVPPGVAARVEAALAGMAAGTLETCPEACGVAGG